MDGQKTVTLAYHHPNQKANSQPFKQSNNSLTYYRKTTCHPFIYSCSYYYLFPLVSMSYYYCPGLYGQCELNDFFIFICLQIIRVMANYSEEFLDWLIWVDFCLLPEHL